MKSSLKAELLFKEMKSKFSHLLLEQHANKAAKECAISACYEILNTKNYPNTLHPEMTEFNNAYWKSVIEEIKILKV